MIQQTEQLSRIKKTHAEDLEFWAPTQAHHDDQRQAAGEEELHRRPPADGGRRIKVCLSALGPPSGSVLGSLEMLCPV